MTNLRKPPRGWKAFFWRAPIFFYRVGLGWILGERFLLLNHIGRNSGLPRQAVLEIVHHNTKNYYVASGFGENAQWFKNIMHTPQIKIQVGKQKLSAQAERLPLPEAKTVLTNYAEAHPRALRELSRMIGLSYDGSKADLQNLAELLPVIAFRLL